MIDITTEELLTFRQVAKRFPRLTKGKDRHITTVYRWAQRGVKGIKLEYIQIGGSRYTSEEALQKFTTALTIKARGDGHAPASRSRIRDRQMRAAEKALDADGI